MKDISEVGKKYFLIPDKIFERNNTFLYKLAHYKNINLELVKTNPSQIKKMEDIQKVFFHLFRSRNLIIVEFILNQTYDYYKYHSFGYTIEI